jgi:hypothetical protein
LFKLQSDRSAICNDCGNEAVRQFGFCQIKEASPLDKSELDLTDVIPLHPFRKA